MPAGVEVTVPLPVPAFVTVRLFGSRLKVAVTDLRGVHRDLAGARSRAGSAPAGEASSRRSRAG